MSGVEMPPKKLGHSLRAGCWIAWRKFWARRLDGFANGIEGDQSLRPIRQVSMRVHDGSHRTNLAHNVAPCASADVLSRQRLAWRVPAIVAVRRRSRRRLRPFCRGCAWHAGRRPCAKSNDWKDHRSRRSVGAASDVAGAARLAARLGHATKIANGRELRSWKVLMRIEPGMRRDLNEAGKGRPSHALPCVRQISAGAACCLPPNRTSLQAKRLNLSQLQRGF